MRPQRALQRSGWGAQASATGSHVMREHCCDISVALHAFHAGLAGPRPGTFLSDTNAECCERRRAPVSYGSNLPPPLYEGRLDGTEKKKRKE